MIAEQKTDGLGKACEKKEFRQQYFLRSITQHDLKWTYNGPETDLTENTPKIEVKNGHRKGLKMD